MDKGKTLTIIIVIAVIVIGLIYLNSGSAKSPNPDGTDNGDFQKVTLSMKNYNYFPNTITVKEGTPVRIYLDNTIGGCYRSFVIRDFGINQYLKTPSDYVEFTPDKKGTFRFSCSMGMGTGTIIVE